MKALILIVLCSIILIGCGIQYSSVNGYEDLIITIPPPSEPIRIDSSTIYMYCQGCGQCIPETVDKFCTLKLPECSNSCGETFRCRVTGKEFRIGYMYCDEIIWFDFWDDWPPHGWVDEPEIIITDIVDTTIVKNEQNEKLDMTKPTRPIRIKTRRAG